MLKLSDLAQRIDFRLGPLSVSPSRRHVQGPAGEVHVEPLVMQAFLLLLHARGKVITRQEMFDSLWGGVMVGDDSLNRAISAVRRIAAETGPDLFEIETIPRTGYRLIGEILSLTAEDVTEPEARPAVSRRVMVGGGLTAAVASGTAGLWWATRDRPDPRVAKLLDDGRRNLRVGLLSSRVQAAEEFRRAAALDPDNAEALGLWAFSQAIALEIGPEQGFDASLRAAERTARAALAIDSREPNALLAMLLLRADMMDTASREDEYRRIIAIEPGNTFALNGLGMLLHGAGRCRESFEINERAIAIAPLSPNYRMRKAMRLWVLGRVDEADRVSDRSMELWPSHQLVRLARLMIYALSGRPRAALAMVEEEEANPILLSPKAASVWRVSLEALENPTRSNVTAATQATVDGSRGTAAIAAWAILILSALRELDAAFEVANGFLLARGSVIVRSTPTPNTRSVNAPGWRNSFGLFVPPTKAMRLDPRFRSLADGLGLTEYWRKRGIGPDAFLFKA